MKTNKNTILLILEKRTMHEFTEQNNKFILYIQLTVNGDINTHTYTRENDDNVLLKIIS